MAVLRNIFGSKPTFSKRRAWQVCKHAAPLASVRFYFSPRGINIPISIKKFKTKNVKQAYEDCLFNRRMFLYQ